VLGSKLGISLGTDGFPIRRDVRLPPVLLDGALVLGSHIEQWKLRFAA
jgi:hypothetical protein